MARQYQWARFTSFFWHGGLRGSNVRKPRNFQPSLLEFPLSEPRQKIPFCAEVLRLGKVVITIPSDLVSVAVCLCENRIAGIGTAQFMALLQQSQAPRVVCGQTCPELWPQAGSGARADLCLSVVQAVSSWGAASYRGAHRASCCATHKLWHCLKSSCLCPSSSVCFSWWLSYIFRLFYSALWYMGSYVVHNNALYCLLFG